MGIVTEIKLDNAFEDDKPYLFKGVVVESNKNIKVLKIVKPDFLGSTNVVFRSDMELDTGDILYIYGSMKELSVTYKNPYTPSWKWLKQLEGINLELKGTLVEVKSGGTLIDRVRRTIKKKIEDSGAKHQGIIKALIIGDRTSIDEETKTIFKKTGTSHILAISGLHVGIITGFFFVIVRWSLSRKRTWALSGKDKRLGALITIVFPVLFMMISGANVSTIRATFMVSIFLLAVFFERERDIFNTVFFAALVILLVYPHSLFTPSFQLSFLSVIFILLINRRVYPLINVRYRSLKWLLIAIVTTLSATVGTLPVILYHFYGFNPFSIVHNIISIPLMCFISLPLIFLGVLFPSGGHLLSLSGEIIDINMEILKALDFGYIFPFIRPTLFESMLYYSIILCILFTNRKIVRFALVFLLTPTFIVHTFFEIQKRYFNDSMCLSLIDVGMGEAILIEAPLGRRILIDGGQSFKGDFNAGKNIITPILLSKKILTLDYVINTHPHGDHIGGIPYILENFHVKRFITSGYYIREPLFLDIMGICEKKRIEFDLWFRGDGFSIGEFNLIVLHPERHTHTENLNNASLVIKTVFKNRSFLLTGDIESDIEEKLLLDTQLKSDVLKVSHHGSNNSSSLGFLLAVKPEIALLSVGKGIKGLPGDKAISRFKALSIPVLSTLQHGYLEVCTRGDNLSVRTQRGTIY